MFWKKIFVGFILLLNWFNLLTAIQVVDQSIVTLHHGGQIRGSFRYSNLTLKGYHSFKGIPYAAPPIGPLRLKGTVPHKGWDGVKDATEHGNICVQLTLDGTNKVVGAEDCLYLNVYTPEIRVNKQNLPVMVYIHGGAFLFGSGNEDVQNPELLLAEGVVVVTINYRLGFLGFFSTEDRNSPGNYGLKDSLEALKWVKSNIKAFGGDRNKITLFGQSAGAMITHHLTLSPLTKGLFHQAIAMSGSGVTALGFQEFPETRAYEMANEMNITFDTTEDLVRQLMEIKNYEIFALPTPPQIGPEEFPKGKAPPFFSPCVEPYDSLEPRVIPEHPLKLLLKGNFLDIPYIFTLASEENLAAITEIKDFPNLFDHLEKYPQNLLPYTWKIQPNTTEASEYLQQIYQLYFNNKPIEDSYDYTHFASDTFFNYGSYKAARLHVAIQTSPVFFSIFSFDGDLNYQKVLFNLTEYDGASHADDLSYLFTSKIFKEVTEDNPAFKVRAQMVRMWANFAKFGNPTENLDELVDVNWPAMVEENYVYMNIGNKLKEEKDPFGQRMPEWWEMDKKFN